MKGAELIAELKAGRERLLKIADDAQEGIRILTSVVESSQLEIEHHGRLIAALEEMRTGRPAEQAKPEPTFGNTPPPEPPPRDPQAKSLLSLVTPKQLGMIRALAREAGVDADEECDRELQCKTDELSKRAASWFIDHLKSLTSERVSA